jgi:hypothetical protein
MILFESDSAYGGRTAEGLLAGFGWRNDRKNSSTRILGSAFLFVRRRLAGFFRGFAVAFGLLVGSAVAVGVLVGAVPAYTGAKTVGSGVGLTGVVVGS